MQCDKILAETKNCLKMTRAIIINKVKTTSICKLINYFKMVCPNMVQNEVVAFLMTKLSQLYVTMYFLNPDVIMVTFV